MSLLRGSLRVPVAVLTRGPWNCPIPAALVVTEELLSEQPGRVLRFCTGVHHGLPMLLPCGRPDSSPRPNASVRGRR
jgi:hypothetical protein